MITVKVPAKINLTLDITGVMGGYHLLDSIIVPVNLFDTVRVDFNDGSEVSCKGIDVPDISNTACKAARLMMEEYWLPGAAIEIAKGIPFSGGLGGSTADGVAVIKAYERRFGLKASAQTVARLASDAPAMYAERAVRVNGRGEKVAPVGIEVRHKILLKVAEGGVDTARCYAEYDASEGKSTAYTAEVLKEGIFRPSKAGNALHEAATRLNGNIGKVTDEMFALGAEAAYVTGSGSGVIGFFGRIPENLPEEFIRLEIKTI